MITPNYEAMHPWEAYYKELHIEYQQALEEGIDVSPYEQLFKAIRAMPNCREKEEMGKNLFDFINSLPVRPDYPYTEPSGFNEIIEETEKISFDFSMPSDELLEDKMKGAWFGRICGCMLGKPLEGMRLYELVPFLKDTDNYPMHRYIVKSDLNKVEDKEYKFNIRKRVYDDGILSGMPSDDDTNYIMMAYLLIKKYTKDFTPENDANHWLWNQPKDSYCTAERVAYKNFVNGIKPPYSAVYLNPYREWIGAQIRGDLFGWICPGNPYKAAEMAWKDASMTHIKNGIYGEMWVSAMLAAVGGGADIPKAIEIGLSYVPKKSRFFEAIRKVIDAYNSGVSEEEFFNDFHSRWIDTNQHHWCHTISNAEICAASLLYGKGDYARSICMSVEHGFDTDCNGATVGSVVGFANGFSSIPSEWTDKISNTLFTTIFSHDKIDVTEFAHKTIALI